MGKRKQGASEGQPRHTRIALDFGVPVRIDRFRLDPSTGHMTFLSDGRILRPKATRLERGYEAARGWKTLQRMPLASGSLSVFPDVNLRRYESMLLVDTSYTSGPEEFHAVTVAVPMKVFRHGSMTAWRVGVPITFEFREPVAKPERLGMALAVDSYVRIGGCREGLRYALVGDSDLREHACLSARAIPLFGLFFLPDDWEVVYVSSDNSVRTALGNVFREVDRLSRDLRKYLADHADSDVPAFSNRGAVEVAYRVWSFDLGEDD